jgi:glycosyltransferase involved in cell wall biosynthesis
VDVVQRVARVNPRLDVVVGGWPATTGTVDVRLAGLQSTGCSVQTWPALPYDQFFRKLNTCAIGVQPLCLGSTPNFNWGKTAGKLAAYAGAGLAMVATDVLDHGKWFIRDSEILLGSSADDLAGHISRLLSDIPYRVEMGLAARRALETRLTPRATAEDLDRVLRQWMAL